MRDIASFVFGPDHGGRTKTVCAASIWAVLVIFLATQHVFWRDEVRAFSVALQGENLLEMLRRLHGEGHPAVWYLLLRGAYELVQSPLVLPVVSMLVAFGAAALLALRSPFAFPFVALLLLGRSFLYEYSVSARNYGISLLLMFAFAALYARYRDRGVVLGVVLFLLANCNVHSVLLAGAFMLFWLIDLAGDKASRRAGAWRVFVLNVVILCAGAVACAATVYPSYNDAGALPPGANDPDLAELASPVLLPAISFGDISGYFGWRWALRHASLWHRPWTALPGVLGAALLFGCTLGLVRRPAAMLATWVALLAMTLLFVVSYAGGYRHQALWLGFVVAMYWIAGRDEGARGSTRSLARVRAAGLAMLAALLVLQVVLGLYNVANVALGKPESRSRDLARLIARMPELRHATIMADPDYLVEPLPYYLPNPTYLPREERIGGYVRFTRQARLSQSLEDLLADAKRLRDTTRQPVVILLGERLEANTPARAVRESYIWQLSIVPEQVSTFLSSTRRLERFGPVCCSDESFDVYVLD